MPIKQLTKKPAKEDGSMSLTGHLKELRTRLIVCVAVLVIVSAAALSVSAVVVENLLGLGLKLGYQFVYLAPQELMIQYFKISILAGICVCFPVILYEVWAFMRPGLKKGESRFFLLAIVFGLFCFCVGIAFAYYITFPAMLYFFSTLNTDYITASISVEYYLNFLLTVFIIFGVVFEMPMLSVVLSRMGLVTPELLKKIRGGAIVVIFLIAAIITPSDVFSQFMVAIPMVCLYQLSILLSRLCARKKKPGEDDEDDDEDEDEA